MSTQSRRSPQSGAPPPRLLLRVLDTARQRLFNQGGDTPIEAFDRDFPVRVVRRCNDYRLNYAKDIFHTSLKSGIDRVSTDQILGTFNVRINDNRYPASLCGQRTWKVRISSNHAGADYTNIHFISLLLILNSFFVNVHGVR